MLSISKVVGHNKVGACNECIIKMKCPYNLDFVQNNGYIDTIKRPGCGNENRPTHINVWLRNRHLPIAPRFKWILLDTIINSFMVIG